MSALNPKVLAGTIAPKPQSTGSGRIEVPAQRLGPEPHQGTITPDHVLSPEEWDLILHAALITSIMEEVRHDQGRVGREPWSP